MSIPLRERNFGELLSLTFSLTVMHFGKLFLIVGLLGLPQLALGFLPEFTEEESVAGFLMFFVALILMFLLVPIQQGACILIVSGSFTDKKYSVGESFRVAFRKFGPFILLAFATSFIYMFGVFLFVIPLFIFMTWYYVSAAALLVEDLSAGGAMARSKELSEGYRWRVLGFLLVTGLIAGACTGVEKMLVAALGEGYLQSTLSYLFGLPVVVLLIVAPVVYYFNLRVVKESFDVEALTSLVDAIAERQAPSGKDAL